LANFDKHSVAMRPEMNDCPEQKRYTPNKACPFHLIKYVANIISSDTIGMMLLENVFVFSWCVQR
jgi:hypothetical protein